ncbi:MAG: ATP-binding protein [Bacteroidales bacterium]|nr:ATP-binding protein [Bacteroidales bacterium]
MILSSFYYKTIGWELDGLDALRLTNLLVGKNASGKTRTIKAIQNVTSFLSMHATLFGNNDFKTKLSFSKPDEPDWKMDYFFSVDNGNVTMERLTVCGKDVIKRDTQKTTLDGNIIDPPVRNLVVQVRRDRVAYPEMELLMEWAEGVVTISCSDINPFTILSGPAKFINPIPFSYLVSSLSKEEKRNVIKSAKCLGYDIVDMIPVKTNSELKLVAVKERYLQTELLDFQLSSGMMRVLYILCFLEYVKHKEGVNSLILIDDLGEGLDYNRATLLGKKVFETCEEFGLQLIASSNDSFLMDVTDTSKWQIIRRKHSKVSAINQTNTPELFRQFRMTGLSNFDLFSSDFIDNFLTPSTK